MSYDTTEANLSNFNNSCCILIFLKGQAKAIIINPIRPISESDKCQLRGRCGQSHHENVMSTPFIFLLGALRGSSEADRGQFHQEKVISTASIFSLTAMGKLGGSQGLSGVLGGSSETYRGQFYWEKLCLQHLFFFEFWGD